MGESATNYYRWEGTYADSESYSGHKRVYWTDEDECPNVANQLVPKFEPLKEKHFYRYLTPGFMKQYKNYIKLYNTIVQLISKGCN